MDITKKVLDEIKNGVSPEDLGKKVPWKELSGNDFNDLLAIALRIKESQQSYNLLVYLFNISFGKDLWLSTEVLGQAIQHPHMTNLDRQAILPTLRSRLDQIKDQIAVKTPPEEKLVKYWLMEATYYAMNGTMLAENARKAEAIQNFKIAQSIFEQLGLTPKAAEYRSLARKLLASSELKPLLPKTSPIRFTMPPTQPLGSMGPAQVEPSEPTSGEVPEGTIRSSASAEVVGEAPTTTSPGTVFETDKGVSVPLSADRPLELIERQQPIAELPLTVVVASPTPAAATGSVENAAPTDSIIAAQEGENLQSQPLARREGSTVAGIYYPLPDVWLEEGRLYILGMEKFKGDETLSLAEQIRQQSEILVGIQLQIQMYSSRRTMLERDMKWMEKRALALQEKIARLENKLANIESTD